MNKPSITLHPNAKDITGQVFGRLTALRPVERTTTSLKWLCVCECENTSVVKSTDLRSGNTKSCGCGIKRFKATHGLSGVPEHRIWRGMRDRINNPNDTGYKLYGGRGIGISKDWDDFSVFYSDMGPRPTPQHSIERENNEGDYCKENCSWQTIRVQNNNRRNTTYLNHNGVSKPFTDYAREYGIKISTLRSRMKLGWSVERMLTTPVRYMRHS